MRFGVFGAVVIFLLFSCHSNNSDDQKNKKRNNNAYPQHAVMSLCDLPECCAENTIYYLYSYLTEKRNDFFTDLFVPSSTWFLAGGTRSINTLLNVITRKKVLKKTQTHLHTQII